MNMNTSEITRKLTNDLYVELEETLLCVMAAGVPANRIMVSQPEMVNKDYVYSLVSNISFRP